MVLTVFIVDAGYTAGADALRAITKFVAKLKKEKPDLIYLLDRMLLFFYFSSLIRSLIYFSQP